MQDTYSSFLTALAPIDLHDSRKQGNSTDNSGCVILSHQAVRAQSSDDLKRDVTPNGVTHNNNSYISMSIIGDVLHEISQLILSMTNLVLQAIRGNFVPFHGVDLMALHLKARERATVDLELHIAVGRSVACQESVEMCQESAVVLNEARVAGNEIDDIRPGCLLPPRLVVWSEVYFGSRCGRHCAIVFVVLTEDLSRETDA